MQDDPKDQDDEITELSSLEKLPDDCLLTIFCDYIRLADLFFIMAFKHTNDKFSSIFNGQNIRNRHPLRVRVLYDDDKHGPWRFLHELSQEEREGRVEYNDLRHLQEDELVYFLRHSSPTTSYLLLWRDEIIRSQVMLFELYDPYPHLIYSLNAFARIISELAEEQIERGVAPQDVSTVLITFTYHIFSLAQLALHTIAPLPFLGNRHPRSRTYFSQISAGLEELTHNHPHRHRIHLLGSIVLWDAMTIGLLKNLMNDISRQSTITFDRYETLDLENLNRDEAAMIKYLLLEKTFLLILIQNREWLRWIFNRISVIDSSSEALSLSFTTLGT